MQAQPNALPPPGVVFDTDLGSIDDTLALAMLYGASARKGAKVRLASVSISRPDLRCAAYAEAVGGFYSEISNRDIPARFRRRRSLPVGLAEGNSLNATPPWVAQPLARKNDDGEPLYPHEIYKLNDTAEVSALIRNALTAYHDQNCIVALAGPASNLDRLLDVGGALSLIEKKVRFLTIAAGAFGPDEPASKPIEDVAAAQRLFRDWPTPIVAVGEEIGAAIPFPASAFETQFDWTDKHPVIDSYRTLDDSPGSVSAQALAAALYAVRPGEGYFKHSEPGEISIDDSGRAKFAAGGHGRHRHLIYDPGQKPCVEDAYVELVSAEPAARELPGFLKRLLEEEKEKEEAKKRAAKGEK